MDEAVTKALEGLRGTRALHHATAEYTAGAASGSHGAMDYLAVAALNRSMALTRGFCDLIESRNFLAAAPLVRLQLDSCLRFMAALSAPDPNLVAQKVLEGTPISSLRDQAGNKLHDRYLIEQLAEKYPWVFEVYKHTSGFVHLSEKHIFNALHITDREKHTVLLKVGEEDAFVPQWAYLQAVRCFKEITTILLGLIKAWGHLRLCP